MIVMKVRIENEMGHIEVKIESPFDELETIKYQVSTKELGRIVGLAYERILASLLKQHWKENQLKKKGEHDV